MEFSDRIFATNRDWDPQYLRELVSIDFFDFKEHWEMSLSDMELLKAEGAKDRYCPLVEDISVDDQTLYKAVEQIEYE